MLDELSRIDPYKFQSLCAQLLQRQFPNLRAVDGSGGDESVDAWIPETGTYFQFHAPKSRVRREKVKQYLAGVARHNPIKWVFVTNRDLTRTQWRWFDALRATVAFPIEAWGATKLLQELQRHLDLRDAYLGSPSQTQPLRIGNQKAESIANIVGNSVNLHFRRASKPRIMVTGTLATDPKKLGYLKYLIRRYIEFKEWELGKDQMRYAIVYQIYRREIKYSLSETPTGKV